LVTGYWNFLDYPGYHARALRLLAKVTDPTALHWDLTSVSGLDSAGALTLWRGWGRKMPAGLESHEGHRRYFDRLQGLTPGPSASPEGSGTPFTSLGRLPAKLGTGMRDLVLHFGQVVLAGAYALAHPRSIPWVELSATIYRAGFRASALIAVVNFLVGMMSAYQIGQALSAFMPNVAAVGAFSTAVLREIGPWITTIIVAGRTSSGITAEIGSMRLTGELDALRAFGVSPLLRLALPRVAGLAITVPLLVLLGDIFSILGGVVVSEAVLGIPRSQFLQHLPQDVHILNFWIGELKGLGNGIIIGMVSTFYGLRAAPSTESLSRQTTSSVVMSLTLVLVLNAGVGAFYVDTGGL